MIRRRFDILNVLIILIFIILLMMEREKRNEMCRIAVLKNENIEINVSKNEEALLKKYVQKIREFLGHGHEHPQNMTDIERQLAAKIDESIQSNHNFSSFVQVLPQYDKTTYKELIKVSWFSYDEYDKWSTLPDSLSKFKRAYHLYEQEHIDELIEMAFYFFAKHEIEFMISDGTLIGSLRHFDQIPWDDDFDLLVRMSDRDKIIELIRDQTVFNDFDVLNYTSTIKVFHKSTKQATMLPWNFPFIDIFPSDENATHLNREFYGSYYNASKENIFPLVLRPLGKYWLPAPKDGEAFETEIRSPNFFNICSSAESYHRYYLPQKVAKINCSDLTAFYSFTQRICKSLNESNVCMEFLKLVEKTIYLFYFDNRPIVFILG